MSHYGNTRVSTVTHVRNGTTVERPVFNRTTHIPEPTVKPAPRKRPKAKR